MYLENVIIDALEPQVLGGFWEAALGSERITDAPDIVETRLGLGGESYLDLCFQQVPEAPADPVRLHLDLLGGARQAEVVEELLHRGARLLDIGQGDVPWVVLADVEGNPFCVMEDRAEYADTGPIAALPLDSADPARDAKFWSWLTGWVDVTADLTPAVPHALRHPSLRGPLLELCHEHAAKGETKNRIHLDIRLEAGDDPDALAAEIGDRGGRPLRHDWGNLPWRSYHDPSGNEFCVLPAPT